MNVVKEHPVHAVVNNAPRIISVLGETGLSFQRIFNGVGTGDTNGHILALLAGNGKYNAATSGFVISASINNGGDGYLVGDVLTCTGGTATTQTKITVDAVDNNGVIIEVHVSTTGVYTAYPTGPVTITGGSGTGASFDLNFPPADYYQDNTTPAKPNLWVCTTAGNNSTSVWYSYTQC